MKSADTCTTQGLSGYRTADAAPLITFRCAACCKPKATMGRKLRFVMGLRQFVCAACDAAMPKTTRSRGDGG